MPDLGDPLSAIGQQIVQLQIKLGRDGLHAARRIDQLAAELTTWRSKKGGV